MRLILQLVIFTTFSQLVFSSFDKFGKCYFLIIYLDKYLFQFIFENCNSYNILLLY